MRLNITTDYAIRIILYLSMKGGIISSKELSETMKIPENYVLKVARKLTRAGLTRTYVGKNGGFAVNKPAQQIDLLSIIEIMENTVKINRCLEEDEYCSRFATATCPVRSFYCILQDDWKVNCLRSQLKVYSMDLKNKERMEANEKNKGISCADGDVYPDI